MTDEVTTFITNRVLEMKNNHTESFVHDANSPFAEPLIQVRIDVPSELFLDFKASSKQHRIPMSRQVEHYIARRVAELEPLFVRWKKDDGSTEPTT